MPNTREKLIELIKDTNTELERRHFMAVSIADHLIASGFIEELQNEAYDVGVDSALHNKFGLSWEDAAGLRKEIKRLQDAARWIPVTERLPPPSVTVLCWYEYFRFGSYNRMFQTYGIGFYFRDGMWGGEVSNGQKTRVLAWMPLPGPPKEMEG